MRSFRLKRCPWAPPTRISKAKSPLVSFGLQRRETVATGFQRTPLVFQGLAAIGFLMQCLQNRLLRAIASASQSVPNVVYSLNIALHPKGLKVGRPLGTAAARLFPRRAGRQWHLRGGLLVPMAFRAAAPCVTSFRKLNWQSDKEEKSCHKMVSCMDNLIWACGFNHFAICTCKNASVLWASKYLCNWIQWIHWDLQES